VGEFAPDSPAEMAGVQKDDRIIGINGIETPYFQDFKNNIVNYKDQDIDLVVLRGSDTLDLPLHVSSDGIIGVMAENVIEVSTQEYSFWQAIPRGFKKTGKELRDYWKQLKLIFTPSTGAYESLGGFISIGSIFPDSFIWEQFWRMTAFLSIILAVMNILPIPGLDGGHVLFLIWEVVTGRKPSDKFLERATTIGFIFLLMLLIYANGNDIIRLFR
jgi:regulator of sigma E protease